MRMLTAALALLVGMASARGFAQTPAPSATAASLDYEFFKTRVQPIFLAKRAGHARCIACHAGATPLRLEPLTPGATNWTDEQSRKNFAAMARLVKSASPQSRLLVHPLAEAAGGDFYHNGGKHWSSQSDPEWQTLKTWVLGSAPHSAQKTRIIQTNAAGDNVHIIDPATNTVVGT